MIPSSVEDEGCTWKNVLAMDATDYPAIDIPSDLIDKFGSHESSHLTILGDNLSSIEVFER